MTRYQKKLRRNYVRAAAETVACILLAFLCLAVIGGIAWALITIFEMVTIIAFQLEPGLIVSEIAKWGLGSVGSFLLVVTSIGFVIESVVEARENAQAEVDEENDEILSALAGEEDVPRRSPRGGTREWM